MINELDHVLSYFSQVRDIAGKISAVDIENMINALIRIRARHGRLFFIGVGGSAANCSHACNDFRKLCGIEAYAATDNVAELTARINDSPDGWKTVFLEYLKTNQLSPGDAIMVLSVGGGSLEPEVSANIVLALEYAKDCGAAILGIVGRNGGTTKQLGDAVVIIPVVDENLVTPHTEAFQAVVWHCLVSHPKLQLSPTKW